MVKLETIIFALVVIMAIIVGCTGCNTSPSVIDSGTVIETQANVISGGTTAQEQAHDLVEHIVTVKDPSIIAKAKMLEATVTKLNADIKKANESIVNYVKEAEKTSSIMFRLAVENAQIKGRARLYLSILSALIVLIGCYVVLKIKKLLPF